MMHLGYIKFFLREKFDYPTVKRSSDSPVDIASGYTLGGQGSIPGRGKFFSSP
jgi:hypothetical protein